MPDEARLDRELEGLRIDRSAARRGRRGKLSTVWIVIGVSLVAVLAGWRIAALLGGSLEVETLRVSAPRAGSAGRAVVLQAAGYVVPHYRIEVASKVVGRVKWMGVEKGDKVKSGDPIVRLEDDEYQARLHESVGSLESSVARLKELEAGSRPEEVRRARANLSEARAQLGRATLDLERATGLWKQAIASKEDFDRAQHERDALAERVESLARTLELLEIGPRIEHIEAAAAEVKRAEGIVAYNRTLVDATVIRAPVTGTVLERNVEVGELVTTGFVGDRGAKGYVVAMADLQDIQVELDISQDDFARVFMSQAAIVATDAYRDREYQGRVVEISPEADRQKATVQVKVQILQPDELIRPEMNANVAFFAPEEGQRSAAGAERSTPLVTIPASAVRDDGSVFLLIDGQAVRREVRVARRTSAGVEIETGLSGGEEVILDPPEGLQDGQSVERREA